MKKSIITGALVAAAVFAAPVANAQTATILKPVRLGASLGGSIPLGDFGQAVNTGYNATAIVALQPAGMPLGFRIEGAFNQFGVKGGGNANIFAVTGNALFNVMGGPDLAPYIIGGAGYYHESTSRTLGGSAENHFGFNIGAGVNIPLSGFATFVEARYNRVSQTSPESATTFVPISVGILF